MTVTLLDLSNNNPDPIDFHAIRAAGCFGVWLKVSEGTGYSDPTFARREADARRAGLHVGGYHFARPTVGGAEAEARYFVERLGPVERRDLHPVLDLEANDDHLTPDELHTWARAFEIAVRNLTGVKCLLYSGSYFVASQHWQHRLGTGAGLWLADYGPNDGTDHGARAPAPWRRVVAHQYTSVGTWPGVHGHVDLTHARRRRRILAHGLRGLT